MAADNLGDIRLFVEAAALGSLSAAGRKIGLSPAAASARLVKLEGELNTRLFERTTRHLRLTAEGALYLSHCQQALAALDDAQAALQAGRSVVSGKLRIAATSDFGRHVLRGWLEEFNERYPQITLALVLGDSMANLLQDDLDLAIRFGVPPSSSMVARPLAPNRRVLCAAPSYLAKRGMPRRPADLHRFECIVLLGASGLANEWRFEREAEAQTYTVPAATSRETNDGELVPLGAGRAGHCDEVSVGHRHRPACRTAQIADAKLAHGQCTGACHVSAHAVYGAAGEGGAGFSRRTV